MSRGNAFLCFCLSECQCFAEAVFSLGWKCENSLSSAPAQGENIGRSPLTQVRCFNCFFFKGFPKLENSFIILLKKGTGRGLGTFFRGV